MQAVPMDVVNLIYKCLRNKSSRVEDPKRAAYEAMGQHQDNTYFSSAITGSSSPTFLRENDM